MSQSAVRAFRLARVLGVSPNLLVDPRHFLRLVVVHHVPAFALGVAAGFVF